MYKKTVTTVLEETDASFESIKAMPSQGVFSTASPENSVTGVALRLAMMQHYHNYVKHFREYLLSKQHTPESTAMLSGALDQLKNDATQLLAPYFGPTRTPDLANAQAEVVAEITNVLNAIAAGQDSNPMSEAARSKISALDTAITSNFATGVLPPGSVATFWNSFLAAVAQQANARVAKDWNADMTALKNAFDTMVFGQPNGLSGFGDVFAKAIILNNPWRSWV